MITNRKTWFYKDGSIRMCFILFLYRWISANVELQLEASKLPKTPCVIDSAITSDDKRILQE